MIMKQHLTTSAGRKSSTYDFEVHVLYMAIKAHDRWDGRTFSHPGSLNIPKLVIGSLREKLPIFQTGWNTVESTLAQIMFFKMTTVGGSCSPAPWCNGPAGFPLQIWLTIQRSNNEFFQQVSMLNVWSSYERANHLSTVGH